MLWGGLSSRPRARFELTIFDRKWLHINPEIADSGDEMSISDITQIMKHRISKFPLLDALGRQDFKTKNYVPDNPLHRNMVPPQF